jgi:DNA-binding transcriptional regulator YhcF (GntR family)
VRPPLERVPHIDPPGNVTRRECESVEIDGPILSATGFRHDVQEMVRSPTLRQLADKHGISRSTIFKRAAREHWKQNAALVEATRKQIVEKLEAKMETATTEVAQLVATQVIAELQPWIEREKAEHIKRIVAIAKRGFRRIEKLWDETEVADSKAESLAAATLDKHDAIIRRNLGMNEASAGSCSLNLHVLTGARTIIEAQQTIDSTGAVTLEKTISQDQAH